MKQTKKCRLYFGFATNGRRGFTLAELIVAIALLSVFGVIVARMFFLSGQISDRTEQLDRAVVLTANITEQWQAFPVNAEFSPDDSSTQQGEPDLSRIFFGKSPEDLRISDFVNNRQNGMNWQTYLDKNLKPCQENEAEYLIDLLLVKTEKTGVWSLQTSVIEFGNSNRLLYSLQGQRYFAGEEE